MRWMKVEAEHGILFRKERVCQLPHSKLWGLYLPPRGSTLGPIDCGPS